MFGLDGLAQGLLQLGGTYMTNVANAKIAKSQMDFQATMSSTAHQREVQDLRAAGLNPILSSKYGGSSTPSGAGIPSEDYGASVGAAMSGVTARQLQVAQLQTERERARGERARSDEAESSAFMADFERRVIDAQRHNFKDNGVAAEAERRLNESKAGATASRIEQMIDEESGELLRSLKRLGITGGSAAQILQLIRAPRGERGGSFSRRR